MKKLLILAIASFIISPALIAQTKAGRVDTAKHHTFYTCPKHSDFVSYKPGKCPKCGMDLSLSPKEQMKAGETRSYQCPIHLAVTSHDPAKCPQCGRKMNLSPKEQMKAEVARTYTCPMHPGVALDKDGKCPKCGTALVEKKKSR
ncbi:heavy metal-binding domain-containing protein [Flavitalea sp. BT771]|uniref:heavy metal-binding domain-containing protein n=1 Tax=Flavitalea sp. BT771 TaxID=3063329 RepID=UPI0026E1A131|nr:heavy metal-binding domain-containing protein [Flavitalea sp. BT771]MDO6435146.1 heavy metal-binding domain-containing protein [Flavitalea sp. BT771]MDV6224149.1 heavy metal-binding domain-containing protein [Flavitalea sp. BT771]